MTKTKQFTLTSPWGDTRRNFKIHSMLNQGFSLKYRWESQTIGVPSTYIFVKRG